MLICCGTSRDPREGYRLTDFQKFASNKIRVWKFWKSTKLKKPQNFLFVFVLQCLRRENIVHNWKGLVYIFINWDFFCKIKINIYLWLQVDSVILEVRLSEIFFIFLTLNCQIALKTEYKKSILFLKMLLKIRENFSPTLLFKSKF